MKKSWAKNKFFVLAVVCFLAIFVYFAAKNILSNENMGIKSEEPLLSEKGTYDITVQELEKAVQNKESLIAFYGQEDCGTCIGYRPVAEQAAKELNLHLAILDFDKVTDYAFLEQNEIFYTPTLIVMQQGNITGYAGYHDLETTKLLMSFGIETTKDRLNTISAIAYTQLCEKMSATLDFMLYIGRPDCKDCQAFYPILEQYIAAHDGMGVYYLNINNLQKENKELLENPKSSSEYSQLKQMFDLQWVPSLYRVVNGTIVSKYEFLSADYYTMGNEEQAEEKEKYIQDLYDWLQNNSR